MHHYGINTGRRDTQCFMMAICICGMWSQLHIIHQTKCVLVLYTHTKKGDTPSSSAYCALPYICLAFCVPPCFGLEYCVPFNNKINYFWRLHLQYEDKMTV